MTDKPDLLVIWPNRPDQMAQLAQSYRLHRLDEADDPEALLAEVGPRVTAAATTGGKGLDRALLAKLPALEIVASSGVGYDTIDVAACTERGVKVTNTPDVLTDDVADLAIGLLIAVRRGLIEGDALVRSGNWPGSGGMGLKSAIAGKRLGIAGLGRIGQAIAKRAMPMGLEIAYFGRSERPDQPYRFVPDLVELAEWSDILMVATAGGEGTRALVDAPVLRALGPQGSLINIARGSVIDEPALIAALRDKELGSAGLDVFVNEPNVDPGFAALDNVVLHPHHASGTVETRDAMAQLVVDNLAAHFAGRPLLTPVN